MNALNLPWQSILTGLLASALLVGCWRAWRAGRGAGWLAASMLLQLAIGGLLWWLLQAPAAPPRPLPLIVYTADAAPLSEVGTGLPMLQPPLPDALAPTADWPRVALPEAAGELPLGVVRVPDLATALRRWPSSRLLVLGQGLTLRDRAAATGLPLHLADPPPATGLTELQPPPVVAPGQRWQLRGRLAVAAGDLALWSLRLIDPQGGEVARSYPDAQGAFLLGARTQVAGRHLYRLEWLDPQRQPAGSLALPVQIVAPAPLRLALQAGAPNPETKFLRRWATDTGLLAAAQTQLRPGLAMRGGSLASAAAEQDWAQLDVLLIEDRVWLSWPQARRDALRQAVDEGLGLLLRITGPVDASAAASLAELGFVVSEAELSRTVRLASEPLADCANAAPAQTVAESPARCAGLGQLELQRRPLQVQAEAAQPLLLSADGQPLGAWRNQGLGRIGLLWLGDSHRIALAVGATEYAELWAGMLARVARARGEPPAPPLSGLSWAGEAGLLCGPWRSVNHPDGSSSRLWSDPRRRDCAAWWPQQSGWHRLLPAVSATAAQATSAPDGSEVWRYVWSVEQASSLHQAQTRLATQALAAAQTGAPSSSAATWDRRWAGWLGLWLLLSLLWWLERRPADS